MEITEGMRVCFSRNFLSITGQVTGPEKPASWGPFAEGTVIDTESAIAGEVQGEKDLVMILWDDGTKNWANKSCLWDATKKHMEPA